MNQKQPPVQQDLLPLLKAIQRSDFKGSETRLAGLPPAGALDALTQVWRVLLEQGQRRRRFLWLMWPTLTLLFMGGCAPCMGGKFDPGIAAILFVYSLILGAIGTFLISLFTRPNFRHAVQCIRTSVQRADSTACVLPLLALAAEPGLEEVHYELWLTLARFLPRLPDQDALALTPEQRTLLANHCEKHGTNLTLAVLLVFTSLKDPRLKDKAERWLRFPDERLQEATRDYLKAIE